MIDSNKDNYEKISNIMFNTLQKWISVDAFIHFINDNVALKVKKILDYFKIFQFDVSNNCNNLIASIFFRNITAMTYLRNLYINKILVKSSLNKNNLLFYDSCLENGNVPVMPNLNFDVQPVFVVGIVDDLVNKTKLIKSILNEKYNYLFGLCLPYGTYKSESDLPGNSMCTKNDYNNILRNFLSLFFNMNTSSITTTNLLFINKFKVEEYFLCIISILLIIIPLFIILFLYIYQKIKSKSYTKGEIIIQLNSNNDKDSELINNKKISINNYSQKIFIPPRWFKHLKNSFDLIKNFKELFNFDINRSDFNNIQGITYIKGIQGIALILYTFGQTFLILCNLPAKEFLAYPFFRLIDNPFFIILFIGLRYCPRIIFSCSGYTLVYKYLCYLDQGCDYYFLKFFFKTKKKADVRNI